MAKREDILIADQLEILTDKIDYILDNEIKQLFYRRSHKMRKDGVKIIKDAPRVDTGRMWKQLTSFVKIEDSKYTITMESNAKLKGKESYSSFQHSGTSKIMGIFFVQKPFEENTKDIEKEIDNIIRKVTI